MFLSSSQNLIDSTYTSYLSNAQNLYFAKQITRQERTSTVSPSANFVCQYFLSNSLYGVDWDRTFASGELSQHGREGGAPEPYRQAAFRTFCGQRLKQADSGHLQEIIVLMHRFDPEAFDATKAIQMRQVKEVNA
jgi:hypothetical protein